MWAIRFSTLDPASLPARGRVDDRDELLANFDELLRLDSELFECVGELPDGFSRNPAWPCNRQRPPRQGLRSPGAPARCSPSTLHGEYPGAGVRRQG